MSIARACTAVGALWVLALGILPLAMTESPPFAAPGAAIGVCGLVLGAALIATGLALAQQPDRDAVTSSGASEALGQLLLLLASATVLRAIHLDSGLWYDEIVTLVEFVRLEPSDLITTYTSTNNHIFFSLLANASVGLFGESAWALRLPAAAFGVASLAAVWWMAHEMASAREARLATWLVALSYHHVWFSQNARGYTGILLCSWLGTALFLRARRGGRKELWLAYAVTLGLGMYTHLSAVFVFAAHGIVYLGDEAWARRRKQASRFAQFDAWPLVGFGLGLLLVLQLYSPLMGQLFATFGAQSGAGSSGPSVTVWKNPLWTVLEIVRGLKLGPASIGVAAIGLAIGGVGFVSIARRKPVHGWLIALPPALALVVLIAIGFNIWPRYFLVSLAFAAIAGMRGLFATAESISQLAAAPRSLPTSLRDPQVLATAAALGIVSLSGATVAQNYRFPKQDYSGARDFITHSRSGGDAVLASGLASYAYGNYYQPEWAELSSVEQLERLQADHQRVWVVYSFSTHMRATAPELFTRFERDFEVVKSFKGTLGDGDVHVLRTRRSADATSRLAS